ncbi:phosphatase PAP2 family protein [Deinococcus sp. QL22]|uniref:phosphatase PAP2 family protein n=1 Tax=Deinococcus sp. QL22 TaxID=2939437 RepID=UPI0020176E82|nr:phosphatase PAP2 family protein [Deinococcus sp. QL22]UQN06038.1 phosphatase PAP2 family protein [Deinococcus sp. QL22]
MSGLHLKWHFTRRELWAFLKANWRALVLLLIGVLAPLLLFLELAEDVFRDGGFPWDSSILAWYRAQRTPELTAVANALAVLGGFAVLPVVTALIAFMLARGGAKAHGWFLILALAGAALLNGAAKLFFQRARPDILEALVREPGFSFPSGHAMSNAAFGFALIVVFWRSRAGWPVAVVAGLWAVAVGASRNYLGVHYPSDVLAGFLASSAWVAGLYLLMGRRWPGLRKSPKGERDTR